MITKIEIENFCSINGRQVIDFTVPKNVPDEMDRIMDVYGDKSVRVPNVAVVYGPNASGKTTLIKAGAYVHDLILADPIESNNAAAMFMPFLKEGESWGAKPTKISIEFTSDVISEMGVCLYSYEIVLEHRKPKDSNIKKAGYIRKEELKIKEHKHGARYKRVFKRDNKEFKSSVYFKIKDDDQRLSFVSDQHSVISVLAKFNHELSIDLVAVVSSLQLNTASLNSRIEISPQIAAKYYKDNESVLDALNKVIGTIDLGIKRAYITDDDKDDQTAMFVHDGIKDMAFHFESSGTRNFFCIFPQLYYVLRVGGVALFDELDRDIHPLLLPEIIRWFHDKEMNAHGAQLIMTCHSATLMEYLEKEEIYFTQKNASGETQVYALRDIDDVRRNENYYAKYLNGIYGAVPKIG